MVFKDLFLDTIRTLWSHKLRTALTMFGIAWGIVSITLMVAAGEGLRVGQAKVAESFGKNIMIVFSGRTSMQAGGTRAGRRTEWSANDYRVIMEQSPDIEWALPELGQGSVPVRSIHNAGTFLVTGSLPPFADVRSIDVARGRYCNWDDENEGRRVCVIGSEVNAQLFAGRDALNETVLIGSHPYAVVGIMRKKDQDSSYDGQDVSKVFIPFASVLRDFPNTAPWKPDSVDRIIVVPRSIEVSEDAKRQVRKALSQIHEFDPRDEEAAPIWDTVENAKQFQSMTDGMKNFLGAVGLTTLFLGGIGVMNVMMVAVRERTREIGVRKAVGATSRQILWQFFCETLIVVFLSGGIGMAIAYGLCGLVNMLPMPPFFAGLLPTLESSLLSFGLLGTVALLAAMYPANRAAAVDPIVALRHEAGG
ncbi:MAG: ABC transporter permease [Blastocatellia bacterium]|jgi:putative ABC transport system permease protein|nr:ABC transporter permease [Blastocatellia bacterium]